MSDNSDSKRNNTNVPLIEWDKLLTILDDRLQLGLLDRLKRVKEYHVEGNTLVILPGNQEDATYLAKDTVKQQLSLFVEDAFSKSGCRITHVSIASLNS
jgi:hypothetical protein